MISLREKLPKIGIEPGTPVSFMGKIPVGNGSYHPGNFVSRPKLLREAIRSMDAPQNWQQVSDSHYDEYWTDEVQGVACDGENWIFSCNAKQWKPGHNDKAIYVFKGGAPLKDGNWIFMMAYKDVPHPKVTNESDEHWGQLTCYNGFVYVAHGWASEPTDSDQRDVVIFKNDNGFLEFHKWIELSKVTSPTDGTTGYPEFQAINPWDGKLYTSLDASHEFFIHNQDGQWEGKTLTLRRFSPGCYIQGACFSDSGHLYVTVDKDKPRYWDKNYKWIFCYSALNGAFLSKIPVLATDDGHELEGICYANVSWPDGRIAQIHAVLLENIAIALDNIWFKSFSADRPEVV